MEYPDTLVCPSCKISETNSLDITKSDITNLEYLNEYKDFKMIGKTKDRRVLLLSGIPIFAASQLGNGKMIKNIRQTYFPNFNNHFDDYIQHIPLVTQLSLSLYGLKDVEGGKKFAEVMVADALSSSLMFCMVMCLKMSAKSERPDHSARNSFPSGHTATAFMGAQLLHNEYGEAYPWLSTGGYAVACLVGMGRILNNRHWVDDVLAGASIGMFSGELGYMLKDLIFKRKFNIEWFPSANLEPGMEYDFSFAYQWSELMNVYSNNDYQNTTALIFGLAYRTNDYFRFGLDTELRRDQFPYDVIRGSLKGYLDKKENPMPFIFKKLSLRAKAEYDFRMYKSLYGAASLGAGMVLPGKSLSLENSSNYLLKTKCVPSLQCSLGTFISITTNLRLSFYANLAYQQNKLDGVGENAKSIGSSFMLTTAFGITCR
ncbi:phosphatase PAP2 family protein [Falsiporphyromonas endometrii]|uniref:Phosphatase PAP2 family protein n=1 Tax=Falsiporphyromonas endometrii TaxID=1387297 RepID=A0ABV9K747_9PORP